MGQTDARECREQAKYCRELAMSTPDLKTESSLLLAAADMEREASELEQLRRPLNSNG